MEAHCGNLLQTRAIARRFCNFHHVIARSLWQPLPKWSFLWILMVSHTNIKNGLCDWSLTKVMNTVISGPEQNIWDLEIKLQLC